MMIARWHIDAKFGHKPKVIDFVNAWCRDIATQIGWTRDRVRVATGSIGARESTVEFEVVVRDLGDLNASWERLGTIAAHKEWSSQLEPYIVSGTPRWEVYRVIE